MAYLCHCRKIQEEKNKLDLPDKPKPDPLYIWLICGGFFMSDVKKLRFLKPETVEKLKLCMEMAGSDAVDLMTEAYGQDVLTRQAVAIRCGYTKGQKKH